MSSSYYNSSSASGESGNVWSGGSRVGTRDGFSRSNDDQDQDQGGRRGSYRGSSGNSYSRGGGGGSYGFRRDRDNDREMELQRDTIYVQDLPKDITREQINDAFSTVGPIKIDDRSGGPKIWIYKDRNTGEANGRATVTYEDDETANRAISEYNDQHLDSLNTTVRVQLAQRRPRNNDRGGYGGGRGYRGGRNNYDNGNSRQGFGSDGNRWGSSGRGFSDNRRGGGGFRDREGGDSFHNSGDRDGYSRGGSYRGASRGNSGSSNYAPY